MKLKFIKHIVYLSIILNIFIINDLVAFQSNEWLRGFKKGFGLESDNTKKSNNLVEASLSVKSNKEKISLLSKAIRYDKNNLVAYYYRALTRIDYFEVELAVIDLNFAISNTADNYFKGNCYFLRAKCKKRLKDISGLKRDLSKCINLYVELINGNYMELISLYDKKIENRLRVTLGEAYLLRGIYYLKSADLTENLSACDDFSKAIDFGNQDAYRKISENCK